jgi:septum formation inhibitor-activating ATPase MinD
VSDTRTLVSLLPAEESDRLLRAVNALLPPVADRTIALLRPPEQHLGAAALHLADAGIMIVLEAGQVGTGIGDRSDERHLVWCRDDIEAAGVPAGMGTTVVAESIEALAWELVRRLAGDLSPGGNERPAAMTHTSGVSVDIVRPHEPGEPSTAATSPHRHNGRVPPPPTWARGVPPGDGPIADAEVHTSQEPDPGPRPSAPRHRPLIGQADAHRSRLPLTPLAALAAMESDAPYRLAPNDATPVGTLEAQDAVGHRPPSRSGGRLRMLIGRAAPRTPRRPSPDLAGLGQVLLRAHSTVVTVGTPKGGPGKTTESAAIGVLGARAVEPHGGSAVLVDANLNNPDSWRQLAVPSDALTVREVVEALNRGALVPNGEFARNERLRVLPERRSAGSAYTAAEIDRLVTHLRLRHTLVVVDLPNTLPSLTEGPKEALVAHWLGHADVAVLPIDLGEASFVAAGEIIDSIDAMVAGSHGRMRSPGLVVPLLLPGDGRRALELPAIADLLDHLRAAGAEIVEVPFTVDVQTASHRRSPIVGASPRTDRAFAGVLSAVVAARERASATIPHG